MEMHVYFGMQGHCFDLDIVQAPWRSYFASGQQNCCVTEVFVSIYRKIEMSELDSAATPIDFEPQIVQGRF